MAEILIEHITEGAKSVNGDGSFDKMMQAASAHLMEEYTKNRIKGTDYSTVYLGAMQATMQQALSYTLGRQVADKQAELLEKQALILDVELIGKELDNDLKRQMILKSEAEIDILEKQLVLMDQEILLKTAQVANTETQTALIKQNTLNAVTQGLLLAEQVDKATAEVALLDQKLLTETAQTTGDVFIDGDGLPVSTTVQGVLGRQIELYTMQKLGFLRDAEQKAAKIMADNYSVRRSTDDAELVDATGMFDANIKEAIRVLSQGVNATFYEDPNDTAIPDPFPPAP